MFPFQTLRLSSYAASAALDQVAAEAAPEAGDRVVRCLRHDELLGKGWGHTSRLVTLGNRYAAGHGTNGWSYPTWRRVGLLRHMASTALDR